VNVPLANNKFPADERWNRWVEESEKSRMIQVTDRRTETQSPYFEPAAPVIRRYEMDTQI